MILVYYFYRYDEYRGNSGDDYNIYVTGVQECDIVKVYRSFPAILTNTNLNTLHHLKASFNFEIGLSDCFMGIVVAVKSLEIVL